MHTRFDRDSYITVDTTNVPANRVAELGKAGDLVTENYTPYDYGSVMHYRATTFASKGYSLKPKIGRFRETEGSLFTSFYDTMMLNIYYKCHCT
ncbi:unnamed protein product [Nippostrongylus brasiliensis]|uniref:Metalloendopeptidase n=1 Tax=Nippostrongylus brasiliensis TaxID=27835 RepID=A0A0N4YGW5_NIPBR|nr:unnamed protein product [Nippostrongylus brasiliensis]